MQITVIWYKDREKPTRKCIQNKAKIKSWLQENFLGDCWSSLGVFFFVSTIIHTPNALKIIIMNEWMNAMKRKIIFLPKIFSAWVLLLIFVITFSFVGKFYLLNWIFLTKTLSKGSKKYSVIISIIVLSLYLFRLARRTYVYVRKKVIKRWIQKNLLIYF